MLEDALAHLEREVQPGKLGVSLLELVDHAQRLQVVLEAAVLAHAFVERVLPGVTEWRVAEVVREADRLGQRFVEAQRARDGARDLRDLDRVREPRAVKIALVIHEHLRLVDEAPERVRMDDAIAIALEFAAKSRRRLRDDGGRATSLVDRGVRRERAESARHALPASIAEVRRSVASSAASA